MLNNSGDNLDSYHTGFQIDENRSKVSSWTLQGDMNFINENRGSLPSWLPGYTSRLGNYDAVDAYGGAINGSWKKNFSGSNPWTLGFQHTLAVGIGYQLADIEFTNRHAVSETPINRMRNLYDSFIQDRIPLAADSLKLILGVRQMHNDYSGNEMQPMGHLLWKLNNHHSLWTSALRMVQTSAGIEEDGNTESATDSSGFLFFEPHILNLQDFDSEALTAYEAGYHWLPNSQFTGDLTFFYNNHQRLLPSNGLFQEAFDDSYFHNTFQGTTHGFDCSLDWQLLNGLDFLVDYTLVGFDPEKSPYGMNTAIEKSLEDTGAGHLISLQSIYNMSNNLQLGLNGRYTGSLKTAQNILLQGETNGGSLLDMDANIRWQATRNLELKLIGKNLFNNGGLKLLPGKPQPCQ
jgi:iron complex outermembrane receptor protein